MHAPLSSTADRLERGRFSDWPLALKSILGFWFFYALTIVARAFLGSDPMTILSNKLFTIAAGIIVTGLVYAAIVLTGFISYLSLRLGEPLLGRLGKTGIRVVTRIMGLILAAVAVQFVFSGVREAFR